MHRLDFTGQFKRDYKLTMKRGFDQRKLEEVITMPRNEQPLPESYRVHSLVNSKNYKDMRECHMSRIGCSFTRL